MSFQIKMEMTMLSMLYSREAIEKAKKRAGRTCVWCAIAKLERSVLARLD